ERHGRDWYDPICEYDRATLRVSVTEFDQRERHEFETRRSNPDLRPPKTYRELETRIAREPVEKRQNITVVQNLKTVVNNTTVINNNTVNNNRTTVNNNRTNANNTTNKIKFEKINSNAQASIAKQATEQKKVEVQRKTREVAAKPAATPNRGTPQL